MIKNLETIFHGATFDDFLLRPQHSIVKSRRDVSLAMPLSRHINTEIPIIGANMDTVTREKMMQALSLEGCFGFLDRNCSIEEQVARVRYVKRQHSYIIENPTILPRKSTVGEAKKIVEAQNVGGLLVEDEPGSGILAGILSHRDMLAADGNYGEAVEKYMTPFKKIIYTSPTITTDKAEKIMLEKRIEKLPLIDGERRIKGL